MDAQGLPCLVTRRWTEETSPANVTVAPDGRSPRDVTDVSAALVNTWSSPFSGWSETYQPSISRSLFSRVRLSHSSNSGTATTVLPASAPASAKRSNWPTAAARLVSSAASTRSLCAATRERRVWPRESKAPALTRLSTRRLLHTEASTRAKKSWTSRKRPCAVRSATSAETAA